MKTRPTATDEEIKSYMDFNSVVGNYELRKAANRQLAWQGVTFLSIIGVGLLLFWARASYQPNVQPEFPVSSPPKMIDSTSLQTSPRIVNEERESSEQDKVVNKKPTASKKEESISGKKETKAETKSSIPPAPTYKEAEPMEGYPHLYAYFNEELRYPEETLADSLQGVVSITFVIDPTGKPAKIAIQNSLGPAFDKEATRLIENMPRWNPAMLNGKPTSARISLPITFQISKHKTTKQ